MFKSPLQLAMGLSCLKCLLSLVHWQQPIEKRLDKTLVILLLLLPVLSFDVQLYFTHLTFQFAWEDVLLSLHQGTSKSLWENIIKCFVRKTPLKSMHILFIICNFHEFFEDPSYISLTMGNKSERQRLALHSSIINFLNFRNGMQDRHVDTCQILF